MKNEILFNFSKFSHKQYKLLTFWANKNNDYDIVIADGAIRSGKTISMICAFFIWSFNFVNHNFIIAGKSVGALKRNVINPAKQILSSWNIDYSHNRSENYMQINGNNYYLFGANNEASQDTLQGLTAAGALADEIALFPKSFVEQMIGRCSVENSKIFCNCNPNNPYHYFKTDFIDKKEEKNIYYLHFTMDDNTTLSKTIKDRYKLMFEGVFYKRYILGQWVTAEGIIYSVFDENIHVVDTTNMVFSKYYVSIDYGVYNAFSAGLWGEYNNTWYRMREYYFDGRKSEQQKDNNQYYEEVKKLIDGLSISGIIIDPSASSFIQTIKNNRTYKVIKAKNSVLEGIERTITAFNTKMIMIDKNCKDFIKELYTYCWDEKASEKGEDIPLSKNNHACDDTRYFVNTGIRWTKSMFDNKSN